MSRTFTMEEFMDKLVTEHNFKWERHPDGTSSVVHKDEKVVKRDGHTFLETKEYGLKEMTEDMLHKAIQHGFNMALDRVKEIENVIKARNLTISVDEVLALPVRDFFLWLSKYRISFVTSVPKEEVPKEAPSNPEELKKEEKVKLYRIVCKSKLVGEPSYWINNERGFTSNIKEAVQHPKIYAEVILEILNKEYKNWHYNYFERPALEEVIETKTKKYRLHCKPDNPHDINLWLGYVDSDGSYKLSTIDNAFVYSDIVSARIGLNLLAKKWVSRIGYQYPVIEEFEV